MKFFRLEIFQGEEKTYFKETIQKLVKSPFCKVLKYYYDKHELINQGKFKF